MIKAIPVKNGLVPQWEGRDLSRRPVFLLQLWWEADISTVQTARDPLYQRSQRVEKKAAAENMTG